MLDFLDNKTYGLVMSREQASLKTNHTHPDRLRGEPLSPDSKRLICTALREERERGWNNIPKVPQVRVFNPGAGYAISPSNPFTWSPQSWRQMGSIISIREVILPPDGQQIYIARGVGGSPHNQIVLGGDPSIFERFREMAEASEPEQRRTITESAEFYRTLGTYVLTAAGVVGAAVTTEVMTPGVSPLLDVTAAATALAGAALAGKFTEQQRQQAFLNKVDKFNNLVEATHAAAAAAEGASVLDFRNISDTNRDAMEHILESGQFTGGLTPEGLLTSVVLGAASYYVPAVKRRWGEKTIIFPPETLTACMSQLETFINAFNGYAALRQTWTGPLNNFQKRKDAGYEKGTMPPELYQGKELLAAANRAWQMTFKDLVAIVDRGIGPGCREAQSRAFEMGREFELENLGAFAFEEAPMPPKAEAILRIIIDKTREKFSSDHFQNCCDLAQRADTLNAMLKGVQKKLNRVAPSLDEFTDLFGIYERLIDKKSGDNYPKALVPGLTIDRKTFNALYTNVLKELEGLQRKQQQTSGTQQHT